MVYVDPEDKIDYWRRVGSLVRHFATRNESGKVASKVPLSIPPSFENTSAATGNW